MKVKELLSNESKWTQKAVARDKDNNWCYPYAETAAKWCLVGAIQKCYPNDTIRIKTLLLNLIHKSFEYHGLENFNDNRRRKFEDIKQLVERADV